MFAWVFDNGRRKYLEICSPKDIDALSFRTVHEGGLEVYLGRSDLAKVVWTGGRIDFVKSQAVQLVASVEVGKVLLQGQIGIMKPSEYKLKGIDSKPLSKWYRKLQASLSAIMAKDVVVIQKTAVGSVKEWPDKGITPCAVSWHKKGGLLKQFAAGAVEFDVR
jgi:hypothetical protein